MVSALHTFLERYAPVCVEDESWGTVLLRISTYLCDAEPPLDLVTSVRCVLTQGERVLVMHNRDGAHIIPGGRRENNEPLMETLRRELLEETGWTLRCVAMLAVLHFQHRGPRPPDYPYPYPDFAQIVYRAEADTYLPHRKITDDYEERTEFLPPVQVYPLLNTARDRALLQAIIHA
jgi:ADP-ribose pyrophosphatase YjhB (NUDIX family)